jgi:hypothetical protein
VLPHVPHKPPHAPTSREMPRDPVSFARDTSGATSRSHPSDHSWTLRRVLSGADRWVMWGTRGLHESHYPYRKPRLNRLFTMFAVLL